eukprot:scaffold6986_cov66-Phaeocystis_antarctica.AAC.6
MQQQPSCASWSPARPVPPPPQPSSSQPTAAAGWRRQARPKGGRASCRAGGCAAACSRIGGRGS